MTLNTPSICLSLLVSVRVCLCVCVCARCLLQMLGRTWGRQRGVFSRLCPSTESGVWARPPRIAPTVASHSAPPIISKSICGYTQVSVAASAARRAHSSSHKAFILTSYKIYLTICIDIPSEVRLTQCDIGVDLLPKNKK